MATFGRYLSLTDLPPPIADDERQVIRRPMLQKRNFRSHFYSRVLPGQVSMKTGEDLAREENEARLRDVARPSLLVNQPNQEWGERQPLLAATSQDMDMFAQDESEKEPIHRQSLLSCYINMTTAFIGGGLLALPYGVKNAGVWAGVVGMIFFALVSTYTLHLLVRISRMLPSYDFLYISEIGKVAFGKPGSVVSTVASVVTQVGFCCAYVIFVGDNLHSLLPVLSKAEWVAAICPLFILLAWLRSLRVLAPTSTLAVVCVLAVIIVVLEYGFHSVGIHPLREYKAVNPEGIPIFWGIAAFGFCIHNLVLPMYRVIEKPEKIGVIINSSVITVLVLYLAFGTFGYLFFGSDTQSVITLNLPHNIIVTIVKISLCVVLTCTFPIQLFPVTTLVEARFLRGRVGKTGYWALQNLIRAMEVILIAGIALAVPLFGLMSSLVGAFSVSAVMFILPPLFYLKIFWSKLSRKDIILNIAILVIGVFGSIVATTVDIIEIVQALKDGSNG